jgi:hypothetical protein
VISPGCWWVVPVVSAVAGVWSRRRERQQLSPHRRSDDQAGVMLRCLGGVAGWRFRVSPGGAQFGPVCVAGAGVVAARAGFYPGASYFTTRRWGADEGFPGSGAAPGRGTRPLVRSPGWLGAPLSLSHPTTRREVACRYGRRGLGAARLNPAGLRARPHPGGRRVVRALVWFELSLGVVVGVIAGERRGTVVVGWLHPVHPGFGARPRVGNRGRAAGDAEVLVTAADLASV